MMRTEAQAQGTYTSNLPRGSYQRSCRNISYNPNTDFLEADCREPNGNYGPTIFENAKYLCLEIDNINGFLRCKLFNFYRISGLRNPPPGSYRNSCHEIYYDDQYWLYARCRRRNGRYQSTKSRINAPGTFPCKRVNNDDGRLECSF